jgi:multidrug transporter EmrE-like cation transporter
MKYLILFTAIVFNATANILIKAGVKALGAENGGLLLLLRKSITSLPLLGGVACFGLALVAYSMVLTRMNLSIAYPVMTSAGFLFIGIASWLLFKEPIAFVQIAGFFFIILGIWMVVR